jgi:hypothetical protein
MTGQFNSTKHIDNKHYTIRTRSNDFGLNQTRQSTSNVKLKPFKRGDSINQSHSELVS